jgi:uncharacterized membrane protein (DUF106 family)
MEPEVLAFFAITITAIVYSVISIHIAKTIGNRTKLKQIQEEINKINKKMQEMHKMSEKEKAEFQKEQDKLPALLSESMVLNFKPLLISLPIFFVLSYLVRTYFPSFHIQLSFSIPTFPYYWLLLRFDNFPNWRNEFGSLGWFILTLLVSSLISQAVIQQIEKRRKK